MDDEVLACIDKTNVKYLHSGQISKYIFPKSRIQAHKEKIPHLIVRVFIITKTKEGKILFLVQRRGRYKKSFPDYYTDSASGHILYKKKINLNDIKNNALRELNEEFGINRDNIKKFHFYDLKTEDDKLSLEIAYIFIGMVNNNVELRPNPEELEINGSTFYSRSELERLIKSNNFVDYSKEIWQELLNSNLDLIFKNQIKSRKKENKKIALFIGRFQPLHHGHIHVIYEMLKKGKFLKIGIGSSQISHTINNPFSKEERKQFIEAALKKRSIPTEKFNIYYIPDIFNAQNWVNHVISIVGQFDILYSNSYWVEELFKNNNYEISKKTTIFKNKYNGKNIRNLINNEKKEWRLLVPNEVISLIQKFNGINRIQNYMKKGEIP